MSTDEQRVRTMAGWIGVEISRSRARTAGKPGFGLYRVRAAAERHWHVPHPKIEADGEWTAYAFTLEAIERSVRNAIGRGRPAAPGTLCIAGAGHAEALPTRWTSAYRGRRDLGCGGVEGELAGWDELRPAPVQLRPGVAQEMDAIVALIGKGLLVMAHEAECSCSVPDRFVNACVVRTTADPAVKAMVGRQMAQTRMGTEARLAFPPGFAECGCVNRTDGRPPVLHLCLRCGFVGGEQVHTDCAGCRETVRSRQRAENRAFQEQHLKERAWGLEQRHAAKLRRGLVNGGESAPSAR